MKKIITVFFLLCAASAPLQARKFDVPVNYSFKGNFEAYEKDIVRAIKWLARTAPDKEVEKRGQVKRFVANWVGGAPHVTVSLNSETMGMRSISGDLYSAYLGGAVEYSIKKDNKDLEGSVHAGIKAAVKYYRKYEKTLGKNETFEKYVRLQKSGKLRQYLKKNQ